MKLRPLPLLSLLVLGIAPLAAFAGEPVTDCTDLGSDREIVRAGGGQHIFLRNGQSHYRVGFAHSCDSVLTTPTIEISTDDQVDRLCPSGSRLRTKSSTCRIDAVEAITAEEFAKRKKRARR